MADRSDSKGLLIKILVEVGYVGDQERFVSEFFRNIYLQTLLELLQSLPSSAQDEIKQRVTSPTPDLENLAISLRRHFSEDQLSKELENASKNALIDYLQSLSPTLSATQKESLARILEEYS